MSDLYFDKQWEAGHPYLASLWRKLLDAPSQQLSAFAPGLECVLLLDYIGSGRVVLQNILLWLTVFLVCFKRLLMTVFLLRLTTRQYRLRVGCKGGVLLRRRKDVVIDG
jgi:hypothetical protein